MEIDEHGKRRMLNYESRIDRYDSYRMNSNISEAFKKISSSAGSGDYEQLCESSDNGTLC